MRSLSIVLVTFLLSAATAAPSTWSRVEQLSGEQKFSEALDASIKILDQARKDRDSKLITEALIKVTQLQVGLHGLETGVRFLREQSWPKDESSQILLNLYAARTLETYFNGYSYEIRGREKTLSTKIADLKEWTTEQIANEVRRSYAAALAPAKENPPPAFFTPYVTPNTYPKGLRSTMRDVTTYQLVEHLANTAFWSPEQSNAVGPLKLGELAAGKNLPKTLKYDDGNIHPLVMIAYALNDLAAFHDKDGRRSAALEARYELIRRLMEASAQDEDKDDLRAVLAQIQQKNASLEWWTVGQALLAGYVDETKSPDRRVRALAIAKEGHDAYPQSPGAKLCEQVMSEITTPSLTVDSMTTDALDRASILVSHKNVAKVHFRAYEVNLEDGFASRQRSNPWPTRSETDKWLARRTPPQAEWSSDLAPTSDYSLHRTLITPPLKKTGAYVIIMSMDPSFKTQENIMQIWNFIAGDLVLKTERRADAGVDVRVVSGRTGLPLANVSVTAWQDPARDTKQRNAVRGATVKTDSSGWAKFEPMPDRSVTFFAREGDQVATDARGMYLMKDFSSPRKTYSSFLYTDRAIYRPGQRVQWKVVVYEGDTAQRGSYKVSADVAMKIVLRDLNGQDVAQKTVTTNAFGSASGEFEIPAGRPLGSWSLSAASNDGKSRFSGYAGLAVEEYKRPTFEVSFRDPGKSLQLNKRASLTGEAKYYFGSPVSSGRVSWTVTRTPVMPWWWMNWGWRPSRESPEQIASGHAKVAADGTFKIEFTPKADEREAKRGTTYSYHVEADVTEDGGETRSGSRDVRLGFVSLEAKLEWDETFFVAKEPIGLNVKLSDLNGVARAGKGKWRVSRLDQPKKAMLPADLPRRDDEVAPNPTPGDLRRARWETSIPNWETVSHEWKEATDVDRGTLDHGAGGDARVTIPKGLDGGVYRLSYETKDDFGKTVSVSKDFIVAAPKPDLSFPLLFLVQKSSYKAGEKARVLLHSGLPNVTAFWSRSRADQRPSLEDRKLGSSPAVFEIPVTAADRGGLAILVSAVMDHQLLEARQTVDVPWSDKILNVGVASFRDRLRPGTKETIKLTVAPENGKDFAGAEVLASMYDRSLDFFRKLQAADPLGIYPRGLGYLESLWSLSNVTANSRSVIASGVADLPSWVGDIVVFENNEGIGGPGMRGGFGGGRYRMDMASGGMMAQKMAAPSALAAAAPMAESLTAANDAAPAAPKGTVEAVPMSPEPIRSDFSETAFWRPHLIVEKDGAASFEFQVPDSLTSWTMWAQAITKDLRAGSLTKELKTSKELMVRPSLPRFLREGDEATLAIVVNNAAETDLSGDVEFDIQGPDSESSALAKFGLSAPVKKGFKTKKGGSDTVVFKVKTPRELGLYAIVVKAKSGSLSDGERRPIPVLPSRMHLAQSKFVTLKNAERKTMEFKDLAAGGDPSLINEKMVVGVDGQLFYGLLEAVPYLIDYPYECAEQTLNRFLATGILSALFKKYPAVQKMADTFSKRETVFEKFDAPDANRRMALEESPWLVEAKGGEADTGRIAKILDSRVAKAERDRALAKLRKMQLPSGGFPWFEGGEESEYMTLYLLMGFARAAEFGIEIPLDITTRAWRSMKTWADKEAREALKKDCCVETITMLNYALSSVKDDNWTGGVFTADDRRKFLDYSFKKWKTLSPMLKGYLSLTLLRSQRATDAKLVWASVMDSAKLSPETGTDWAAEDRSWLWYNDTIESHAFALRVQMEINPKDPKNDGLVQWLFLNKKLNHWKSTKATSEVVYSVASYLEKNAMLGVREEIDVQAGNQKTTFTFEPDEYTGKKNQIVIDGPKISAETAKIQVSKDTPGFAFASATWHYSTEKMPPEERGDFMSVSRAFFLRSNDGKQWVTKPLADGAKIRVGDQLEVRLSIKSKQQAEYVLLRNPRPAGFEPETAVSGFKNDGLLWWYEETRDSGSNFFFERLPVGEYSFKTRLRAATAGTFRAAPAELQSVYAPEFNAFSSGGSVTIE